MDLKTAEAAQGLLGVGLYTAPEAAQLIGVPVQRVRRWLTGYAYRLKGEQAWSEPLWIPQIARSGQEVELGFRDLVELRFVASFVGAGVSVQAIRRALAIARELTGADRPFSTARFHTDGLTVFLQVARQIDEPTLIDLLRNQYTFNRIVQPSFRDIDFDEDVPERWWPMSRSSEVTLDPHYNFGHPIIARHGVPTRAIADAVTAEGSASKVARLYDLPLSAVRDAVAFERRAA
jgi:uncharacterized protein (DUF433 family)